MSSIENKLVPQDSSTEVKSFFDTYYNKRLSFSSNQVDSVIGFFEKRGFDKTASVAITTVLLQQAKVDNIPIFKVLDTLKGYNEAALSALVATILNNNRNKISRIGYKNTEVRDTLEQRNIIL